jgi:hypothetical protein
MILSREEANRWPEMTDEQREGCSESWQTAPEDLRAVEALLYELSQGVWAASWLQDMELVAWDLLHDPVQAQELTRAHHHPYCTGAEAAEMLDELRTLTLARGWFPLYDFPDFGWHVGRVASADEVSMFVAQLKAKWMKDRSAAE